MAIEALPGKARPEKFALAWEAIYLTLGYVALCLFTIAISLKFPKRRSGGSAQWWP